MDIGGAPNNPASTTLTGGNTTWQGTGKVNVGLGGPGQLTIGDTATASVGILFIANGTSGASPCREAARFPIPCACLAWGRIL